MNKFILIILSVTSLSIKGSDRDAMLKRVSNLKEIAMGLRSGEMPRMSADTKVFFNHVTSSKPYRGYLFDGETIYEEYCDHLRAEYDLLRAERNALRLQMGLIQYMLTQN